MQFKTDWTSDDYYNAEDLNRVELGTSEVAQLANDLLGLNIQLENPVTNRDYTRIEFADDLNRVERNIELVRVFEISGLVDMKTSWAVGDPFNFEDANRLETNISILHPVLEKNANNLVYSGEFNAGEEVI